jgi:hypothetical protein
LWNWAFTPNICTYWYGRIVAVTGDTYWTKTKMLICAVDPSSPYNQNNRENDVFMRKI